ncbi:MAG: glycosyltransferase, partial [Acidobacteria bacterium]|nr:glycosyltransferase [Acidobacteriota bacterium]
ASTATSPAIVEKMATADPRIRLFQQPKNMGKGAAIRRAIDEARGEYSIIQDADLEYDPVDYQRILRPLVDGRADAVFGSRFATSEERRILYFWHSLANQLLTLSCNVVSDLNLTDMETCYKAVRTPLLQSIPLKSERFGIEPELTIKLAKRRARIFEVPISYNGRTYEEGKKIGLSDAFDAAFTILRHGLSQEVYKDHGQQILHAFSLTPRFNRWMADTIRPYVGSRVMEFGAGMGNLTRILCPTRDLYVASDIDSEHLSRLQTRLSNFPQLAVHPGDLEQPDQFSPYEDRLDTTVCLNVLEHVKDDMQGLRTMRRVLAPGGRAIVLVPEGQSVYGRLDEVLGHYRRYSKEELAGKMKDAGFEVEDVLSFNRISRPGWYVTGKILKKETVDPFQLQVFDRLVGLWRMIDGALPWSPTSIIAIARKV